MDIKAVTLEEAQAAQDFLGSVPFDSRGTIAAKYEMLSNLVSFKAKLAAAIAVTLEEAQKEEEDGEEGRV